VVSACNVDHGSVFKAGKINLEVLKRSFGFSKT
jgi:methenyltetrahydromethanopterin cyclohydrolase